MPIRTDLWKIGSQPEQLVESILQAEQLLEDMIVAAPRMLSDEWMLIGRQEDTGFGGRIDLLAIAPDASLVLIELKRDRTPREVVAQALDYACWVEKLRTDEITAIYSRFAPGRNLADDFSQKFGQPLDEDDLNQGHQLIIVAASLDASTERIVAYLSAQGIPINVLCFQVFAAGDFQLLSRSWLLDPVNTQAAALTKPDTTNEAWNGEYYCSFGDGASRSWSDAVDLGFICGGGGAWYSRTLQLLNPGDRVWVKVPGQGFVGVGRVTGRSQPAATFKVTTPNDTVSILDAVKSGDYHRQFLDDETRCEYFVPVQWLQTVPLTQAVQEIGLFGNQNTICKPTTPKWRATVERLKQKFPSFDSDAASLSA
ncbi:endonuclease NucS [Cupriavidus lacunae]|uniref:Nuclease n=1 Tax=Cupriavidus lacunae TaxID=2666307 RepID=A0A370MWD9_9BURK|nr:endonuclease NucS [Cupriavidus lacunae]RDJ97675.1 nuclease [Cupriavidus lacunae]